MSCRAECHPGSDRALVGMTNFIALFLSVITASAAVVAAHQTGRVTAIVVATVTAAVGVATDQVVRPWSAVRPHLLRIRQTRERHGPSARSRWHSAVPVVAAADAGYVVLAARVA